MKKLLYLLIVVLFSSCAVHTGSLTGIYTDLNTPYKITATASGHSKAEYFLGIGGLSVDQLVQNAKEDMYLNTPLDSNEVYANVSVNIKNSFYFIYYKTDVFITADIISKRDEEDSFYFLYKLNSQKSTEANKKIVELLEQDYEIPEFKFNETVYYYSLKTKNYQKGYIKKIDNNVISVGITREKPSEEIKEQKDRLFKIRNLGEYKSLISETIVIPNNRNEAKIIGINPSTLELLIKPSGSKPRVINLLD